MPHDAIPVEIRQIPVSKTLEISWSDGLISHFKDADLRCACRCTTCRQISSKQGAILCLEDIQIASISPVGSYAIQIEFNDGHDRGIFPWSYLRELGSQA